MNRSQAVIASLLVVLSLGCSGKKKQPAPADVPPTAMAGSGSGQMQEAPPAPPVEPLSPVEKAIVDGAASRDGKVMALVVRGEAKSADAERPTTPGFVLFARAAQDPKAALAGKWTAFRIFGPGQDRAAARQDWSVVGDKLTIARLGKDARSDSHLLAFDNGLFSYMLEADSEGEKRKASGFTTGKLLIMSQLGQLLTNPETGEGSRENSTTIAVRTDRCGAEAIEGKWRSFRLGSRQIAEWTIKGGKFDLEVWDNRRTEAGKSRKGTYQFDGAGCSAVFTQIRDNEEKTPPAQESFFDPDSGLALSGRGDPKKYSNASLWFRIADEAPKVELAGPWIVYRHPPRVGFVTMDAKGGFDGSTGNSWNEPLTPISGSVGVSADRVSGNWTIVVPEAPRALGETVPHEDKAAHHDHDHDHDVAPGGEAAPQAVQPPQENPQ